MKDCEDFQLKPVAHGWADFTASELIFTLRLAFVVPAVAISRSSLSQFSGFPILVKVRRTGRWSVEGDFTTPQTGVWPRHGMRTEGKTYGTESQGMKLGDSSVVWTVQNFPACSHRTQGAMQG